MRLYAARLREDLTADQIVRMLDMKPHPEGGFFCETYRDENGHEGRAHSTAIYYLLAAGDVSAWHKVDATEVWHWYAGAPLAPLPHLTQRGRDD